MSTRTDNAIYAIHLFARLSQDPMKASACPDLLDLHSIVNMSATIVAVSQKPRSKNN